jgi:hypothetical protein
MFHIHYVNWSKVIRLKVNCSHPFTELSSYLLSYDNIGYWFGLPMFQLTDVAAKWHLTNWLLAKWQRCSLQRPTIGVSSWHFTQILTLGWKLDTEKHLSDISSTTAVTKKTSFKTSTPPDIHIPRCFWPACSRMRQSAALWPSQSRRTKKWTFKKSCGDTRPFRQRMTFLAWKLNI